MSSTPSGGVPAPVSPPRATEQPLPSDGPEAPEAAGPAGASRGPAISEDWLATITGLVILGLVLAGVITKAMIP